ncbi:WhiB family transcriptional regulator [Modestobacter sp. DSM 44400]|uniref:WhiB family transcriptional regulator n=1 Tax=Modestobacter sp. DSM 44400 TaxID=1550230 RepID=UPI0015871442|nr:WhiB family transcriptional regulator [Modestobacter sp. DSM 44400]
MPRLQRRLCLSCPTRQSCLTRALETRSVGYWAGTTTADRAGLAGVDGPLLPLLDARQDQLARAAAAAAAADRAKALHPVGEGNLWWYRRRGCRCAECRAANAAHRAAERARAGSRTKVAA